MKRQKQKMFWTTVTLVSILIKMSVGFEEKDMICSDDFCLKYVEEKGCPGLSEACLAQNSTHNGVYLPYPDICNCCDYCIANLAEDEVCVRGSPGTPPPSAICGPGLACKPDKNGIPTCQPMESTCTLQQAEWDERRAKGALGFTEVRPKCDDDGFFKTAHCVPGSLCYCLSPEGNRIFGEMPFLAASDENKMECGCSLNHQKAMASVNPDYIDRTLTARCNGHGLYDPLQCMMGEEANCFCVDTVTGEPKNEVEPVPLYELKPGNPECFDSSIHVPGTYETECEIMKNKWYDDSSTTTVSSARSTEFKPPRCQPDGKFDRVQTQETKQICVDPSGQQIDGFEALLDSPEASSMDCKCARTRWLLQKEGVVELPSCETNGNFKALQNRRNDFFCVDCNGDQIGVEVNLQSIDKLCCRDDDKSCTFSSCSVTN